MNTALADIEKIEVLRGPQGTLYGRNAMGGVINITTKQPSSKTEGFAELSLGNYQQQRYNAGLRIPLIKSKLFLGISGLFNKRNGYYSNDFDGSSFDKQQTIAGNYYLKYTPRQNWIFTLNVKHQHHKNNGAFPMVLGIDESFRNPFRLNQNAIAQMHDNSVNASLTVNYSNKHFQFFSQTGWQQNYRIYNAPLDGDFSPADVVTIINNYGKAWNGVQVFTNELRLSSPAGKHNNLTWLAGLWLFHQHNPTKQSTHFGKDAGLFGVPDIDFTVTNTNIAKNKGFAFFGQASYEVSKKVTITAGLRYDNEYKQITVRGEYQKDGLSAFVTREDTSAHINFNAFSPKLGFSFKVNKSSMAFVSYTRGFRTGGLTQLSSDPATPPLFAYRPEYSNNIEVGIKNTLYNNKLLLNITLFYTNVKNSQVPTLILPDAITVIRNTGIMNSKGAEIELSTTAIKNLAVEYNMGYTDAAYKSLKISQNGNEVDLNGKKQIFTPAYTNALGVQYNYPINKIKPAFLYVRVEWMALGKQYFDFANTISQSAYSLFNAKAGVNTSKIEISAWARNISNIKYIAYAYDFGAVHLGNPITCGVTIRKSFSLKNK